ncbi:MAG TPA: FKBP-type peptidyl-prolyl cis-trans isomerase [Candidatus Saccharimonadales bacterium]|nr:FKBP-type peptidyl-prolyl cis-trans isomerase [Candidatus Saccharimonadales bacterium]
MATSKKERFFALFMALLFLASASAFIIALVVQHYQNQHQNNGASSQQSSQTSTNQTNASNKGKKLEGTQLANYTPMAHIDSLQEIDTTPGTGQEVKSGDTVTVDYTGAVAATGVIFQSSLDSGQPVTFPLSNVIQGWQQGIPGMKVGGTRRLLIPAAMAYGANPPAGSGIPANADLVFDVTLHSIGK